jgi:hypothetical protein
LLLLPALPPRPAAALDLRAQLRAAGGDRTAAVRVAKALLVRPLDLQLLRVRCEDAAGKRFCGLILSGVKFHQRVNTALFLHEVDALVGGAFAVDPAIAEVDLWVTVPLGAGKGAIVSGDVAQAETATVYATTVVRGERIGADAFWDPAFRSEIARGSSG